MRGGLISAWIIVAIGMMGSFQALPNAFLVASMLLVVIRDFELRMRSSVPLVHVAAIVACLQWTVGPVWFYHGSLYAGEMGMNIPASEYFAYAIPGTAAFTATILGLSSTLNRSFVRQPIDRGDYLRIGIVLALVAFAADVIGRFTPSYVAFLLHLLSQVRYVACLYFLYSSSRARYVLVALSLLPLVSSSAGRAMFHDMLIWGGILLCYWLVKSNRKQSTKLLAALVVLCGTFSIQAVKGSYRAKVWNQQTASLTSEMLRFWNGELAVDTEDVLSAAMVRLNQGWIISAVMEHVPAREPYARGETVSSAIVATLVPRVLYQGKVEAGGRVGFKRFTGLPINHRTSMNLSILGEAYANFGPGGGAVFMAIVGALLTLLFSAALARASMYPTFFFWIPLIFYQAIKAETDLAEVLNQISKGGVVAIFCHRALIIWFPESIKLDRRP